MKLETYPSREELEARASAVPEFMRPNEIPYAAVLEGYLSKRQCEMISDKLGQIEPYEFPVCGAETRECEWDPTLDPIEEATRYLNWIYWSFDLDPGQYSWLQTYESGGAYRRHQDGAPGQMRKLTAVALLSEADAYQGGDLILHYPPRAHVIPRTQGTIVVFPGWLEHEVLKVKTGLRQTVNMGFWGPPFR